jgi:low affinity Fe/Cu permease
MAEQQAHGRKSKPSGKSVTAAPAKPSLFSEVFATFAQATSRMAGRPTAFLLAVVVVVIWLVTGPLFDYSDTWQLIINTGTTIVTFLMVFLIQNSQNRDTLALQLKLSELILTARDAEDRFASIETLPDEELEALHEECRERADRVFGALKARRSSRSSTKRKIGAPHANGSKARSH